MAGPERNPNPVDPGAPETLPGHFVSPEHRDDCARFLSEVRSLIDRRREADRERRRLGPPS